VDGGPRLAVLWHQEPARDVQEDARTAEEHQHHEGHAHQYRVDVEVPGQAAGDTGELAIGSDGAPDPGEVADLVGGHTWALVGRRADGGFGRGGGHGTSLLARRAAHHRGRP